MWLLSYNDVRQGALYFFAKDCFNMKNIDYISVEDIRAKLAMLSDEDITELWHRYCGDAPNNPDILMLPVVHQEKESPDAQ